MPAECCFPVTLSQANPMVFSSFVYVFVNDHSKGTVLLYSYLHHFMFCWGHWGNESCQVVIMVQNSWPEYYISAWPLHIWALRRCSTGTVQCHRGNTALISSMCFPEWQHAEINSHLLIQGKALQVKCTSLSYPAICVCVEELKCIFSVRSWSKSSLIQQENLLRSADPNLDSQHSWKWRMKYYFAFICFGRNKAWEFSCLFKWSGTFARFAILFTSSSCVWDGGELSVLMPCLNLENWGTGLCTGLYICSICRSDHSVVLTAVV